MSLKDFISDFENYANKKGKTSINKDGSKTIDLTIDDAFCFLTNNALKKTKNMSKDEAQKLLKNQPKVSAFLNAKIEPPK